MKSLASTLQPEYDSRVWSQDDRIGSGRVAMIVEYNGARFHGFQTQQEGVPSVQAALEKALSRVADEPVSLVCAGRTDTGVHATHQVIHFDTNSVRSSRGWVMGANTFLDDDIAVHAVRAVPESFHARYSASARRYRYLIYNSSNRPALFRTSLTWNYRPLDAELMHEAAQVLVGEHDFSSFRAAGCQSNTPFRNVHSVQVQRRGRLVMIDIQANAFLHHMVRNIAGVLMAVGCGKQPASWVGELLEHRDRKLGGATAPAYGLYFVDVTYDPSYGLPSSHLGPAFLDLL